MPCATKLQHVEPADALLLEQVDRVRVGLAEERDQQVARRRCGPCPTTARASPRAAARARTPPSAPARAPRTGPRAAASSRSSKKPRARAAARPDRRRTALAGSWLPPRSRSSANSTCSSVTNSWLRRCAPRRRRAWMRGFKLLVQMVIRFALLGLHRAQQRELGFLRQLGRPAATLVSAISKV